MSSQYAEYTDKILFFNNQTHIHSDAGFYDGVLMFYEIITKDPLYILVGIVAYILTISFILFTLFILPGSSRLNASQKPQYLMAGAFLVMVLGTISSTSFNEPCGTRAVYHLIPVMHVVMAPVNYTNLFYYASRSMDKYNFSDVTIYDNEGSTSYKEKGIIKWDNVKDCNNKLQIYKSGRRW